jgi:hypothetical protein
MAALVATAPTRAGTTTAGAAVAASDTIARGVMGSQGCLLEIINGNAGADNMTISDASATASGAAAAALAPSVPAGQSKIFWIKPAMVDLATGLVTVTHSVTATVTYKLYPID